MEKNVVELLCFDISFVIGGAIKWLNVIFAARVLPSELRSATPTEDPTGLGSLM